MNSLETPLSQFQHDLTSFSQNKITKKIFLKKYGHLRPGTYDIESKTYKESYLNYFNKIEAPPPIKFFQLTSLQIEKIQTLIQDSSKSVR